MKPIEQLNLFGEFCGVVEEKKPSRKRKTMQEIYGYYLSYVRPFTCKECKHLARHKQSKTWYKCDLWDMSGGTSTDIRVKQAACGKFEIRH